jgi:hypothetical protein
MLGQLLVRNLSCSIRIRRDQWKSVRLMESPRWASLHRFDMSFDGGFWSMQSFIRDVVSSVAMTVQYPELIVGDDNDTKREIESTR